MIDVVADCGADPTGQQDATLAFQRAADKSLKGLQGRKSVAGMQGVAPAIQIPAGVYLLSKEIRFGPYVRIVGERSIVVQSDPSKRSFVFDGSADVGITGLQFQGGQTAIWIGNPNIDGSMFRVHDCGFDAITGYAVVFRSLAESGILSAQALLSNCRWRSCFAALGSQADQCVIRDSWIIWKDEVPTNDACVTVTRGILSIENSFLIPVFANPTGKRWIDNHGSVFTHRARFGGEGAGIAILYHYTLPPLAYPNQGESVVFRDSQLSAGPSENATSGIVTLMGGVPSLTVFDGNTYLVDVPWIREAVGIPAIIKSQIRKQVQVRIGGNQAWPIAPSYPGWMTNFVTRF